jgi:LacI family transcriptional regulator
VAERHGYDLITYNTDGAAETELKCLRSVRQGQADGIIGSFFHATAEHLRPLLDHGIAVVRFEARRQEVGDLPLDTIYLDNRAAAYAAVSYLIERGHRRIGMIAGRQGPRSMRVLGYRLALTDHNIPLNDSLIRDSDFTEQGGSAGMQELLALAPRPTAVFAANDLIAFGALLTLRDAGLRVPQDMAIVGFDDIPAARFVSPPLTTVAQCAHTIGRRAAEMVLERLNGELLEVGRCEEMPYDLIVRESV